MSFPSDMDQDSPCSHATDVTKSQIERLLSQQIGINWKVIDDLLLTLPVAHASCMCCTEDDPTGRLLIGKLISRNPPVASLETALQVFPDCLDHNCAAFFTACRDGTPELLTRMMCHTVKNLSSNVLETECPYPWILSSYVSVEDANALIQAYPQGVLCKAKLLSSTCPLDYFLVSDEFIEQGCFDSTSWNKFKLILVAAGCCASEYEMAPCEISPIHVILNRILSQPGMWMK